MAKYVIEDTTLTNMADAIREKTGGTEPITPSNFATEIAGIQSGGDTTQEDGLVEGTLTEYSNDRVNNIKDYMFYSNKKIQKIIFPNVTYIGLEAFRSNTALKEINFPLLEDTNSSVFNNCSSLTTIILPSLKKVNSSVFYGCSSLTTADFSLVTSIDTAAFYNCSSLTTLILRLETICTLNKATIFTGTPIASGTGYIYVPDELVDSYKSATNWSTYAEQIKPISELEGNQ